MFTMVIGLPVWASPDGAPGANSLSGKVIDKASGQTIPGAEVYFPDLHVGAVTDMDGHYKVDGLPAAKLLVKVSMMGYATLTETIDLAQVSGRDFFMSESVTEMHDVVVTGTSKATELKRDPVPTTLVGRRFLREHAATNAIAALAEVPGVSTVNTGPNISKPYIRGLGGNRVLTLFDGIRQEGQQWGAEHGVEVDQFLVDRIEVVKGPASLMYGSDALAGVVNLLPAPPATPGTLRGEALAMFDSNNKGLASSVNIDGNNGKLVYGGRASAKAAADYQNRYDGRVYGTKYRELDLNGYLGVHREWGYARADLSVYDNLQEVPDGSRDSLSRKFIFPLDDAESVWRTATDADMGSYGIADVHQHVQYYRAYGAGSFNLGKARLTAKLGFARSIRREFGYPQHPGVPGLYLILDTWPFDVKYHFDGKDGWEGTAGLNGMLQQNNASLGTELLIPDYRYLDAGPFVHVKRTLGQVDLSGGLRYDVRNFRSSAMYTRTDAATGFDVAATPDGDTAVVQRFKAFTHRYGGLSGSAGMAWNMNARMTLKANIGRGYRAPNAAEATASGVHPGTGYAQLGDADLKPETNLQEDLGLFYAGTHVNASVELFNNVVSNYIYNAVLSAVNGGDSLYMAEGMALPVFKYRQTTAQLYGGEASVDIHPHPLDHLHFRNSVSFVMAENRGGDASPVTDSTRYLPLIPPLRFSSELRYDVPKRTGCIANLFIKVGVQVFAAQDRFFAADGTETRTPGYTLVDAGIGADLVNKQGRTLLTFTVLGTNLADIGFQSNMDRLKYMDNYPANATGRSGIHGMGRNISVKVSVPFGWNRKQSSSE